MTVSVVSVNHTTANHTPPVQQQIKVRRKSMRQKELPKILYTLPCGCVYAAYKVVYSFDYLLERSFWAEATMKSCKRNYCYIKQGRREDVKQG